MDGNQAGSQANCPIGSRPPGGCNRPEEAEWTVVTVRGGSARWLASAAPPGTARPIELESAVQAGLEGPAITVCGSGASLLRPPPRRRAESPGDANLRHVSILPRRPSLGGNGLRSSQEGSPT